MDTFMTPHVKVVMAFTTAAAIVAGTGVERVAPRTLVGPTSPSQSAVPPQQPALEVASIRPCTNDGGGLRGRGVGPTTGSLPGQLTLNCQTVAQLVRRAYDVPEDHVVGGPDWVRTDRYDILAKAQSRASLTAMSGGMLRSILTDRFRLHIRQEIRETRAYALTVALGGPKMRRAQRTDCDESLDAAVPVRRDETGRVRPVLSDKLPCGFLHIGNAANGTAVIQGLYVAIP